MMIRTLFSTSKFKRLFVTPRYTLSTQFLRTSLIVEDAHKSDNKKLLGKLVALNKEKKFHDIKILLTDKSVDSIIVDALREFNSKYGNKLLAINNTNRPWDLKNLHQIQSKIDYSILVDSLVDIKSEKLTTVLDQLKKNPLLVHYTGSYSNS